MTQSNNIVGTGRVDKRLDHFLAHNDDDDDHHFIAHDDDDDDDDDNENYNDNENDMNDDDDDDPYKKVLVEVNKPSYTRSSKITMCSIIVISYTCLKL